MLSSSKIVSSTGRGVQTPRPSVTLAEIVVSAAVTGVATVTVTGCASAQSVVRRKTPGTPRCAPPLSGQGHADAAGGKVGIALGEVRAGKVQTASLAVDTARLSW